MSKHTRFAAAVLGGVLVAASLPADPVGAQVQGFSSQFTPTDPESKELEIGSVAPAFIVKDLYGNVFNFGEERSKRAHLLVFWSIYCEPCREEMPVIQKLAESYRASGTMEVVAVNIDGAPMIEGIRTFIERNKYKLRVVLDEFDADGKKTVIYDPYQVSVTPMLYLVNAEGKIASSHRGTIEEQDLKALVANMLKAK